ncbi:hypothetical protein DW888_10440 [Bacteroides nordii]|uniref:Uncharacterized protein n=1 Tax=Bacteroides nordii TaxID=291645 RepID=A0A413VPH3_9BACE|nr:hypothetical protein DW888_10440 [Bacteroides nordii]
MDYLQIPQKAVSLQCVFHSIRFKVNKGWSKALLLFLCLYLRLHLFLPFKNLLLNDYSSSIQSYHNNNYNE